MAKTLRFEISVSENGRPVSGFDPLVRVVSVDEKQALAVEKADDGEGTTFTALATGQIDNIQALLLVPNRAIKLRLDGQTDEGIELGAQGVLLVLNSTIDNGASTNVTANNNSGGTANIDGFAAGT